MSKIVLTLDQRREAKEYCALGYTPTEARYRVMTLVQKQAYYKQVKDAQRARHTADPQREILLRKKQDAARRGLEFSITEADLDWPTHCPVIGVELDYSGRGKDGRRGPRRDAACIDRRDNTRGYVPGNVVIVSYWVNVRKGDATVEQLQQIAAFYSG